MPIKFKWLAALGSTPKKCKIYQVLVLFKEQGDTMYLQQFLDTFSALSDTD